MIRWLTSLCLLFLAVALGASDPPRQTPAFASRASLAKVAPPQAPAMKSVCRCGPGCDCGEGPNCTCLKPVAAQAPTTYTATIVLSRTLEVGTLGGPFLGIQTITSTVIPAGAYKAVLTPVAQARGMIHDTTIYRDPITGKRWHYTPGGPHSWDWLPEETREEVPAPQPLYHTFAPMPMPVSFAGGRGGSC